MPGWPAVLRRAVLARTLAGTLGLAATAVAAGSGGAGELPGGGPAVAWLPEIAPAVAVAGLVVAAAGFAVLIRLVARRPRRRRDRPPPRLASLPAPRAARIAAALVALAVLTAPVALLVLAHAVSEPAHRGVAPRGVPAGATGATPRPEAAGRPPSRALALLAGLSAAATLAVAGHLVHRGGRSPQVRSAARRRVAGPVPAGQPSPASSPRQAVISAYLTMASTLAGYPPLQSTEPPRRLVHRATGLGLADPASGRRLVELFERARFSPHPVGAAEQAAAQRSLAAVLGGLPRATGPRDAR